jgi:hypothetical protein
MMVIRPRESSTVAVVLQSANSAVIYALEIFA